MNELDSFTPDALTDAMSRDDESARQTLRALSRRYLYFWWKVGVSYNFSRSGRNLIVAETFKERQDWLQWVVCEKKRGLLADPRSFMKSAGATIAITTWLALQRPHADYDHPTEVARAYAYLATHPHLRGVDTRSLIYSDAARRARKWVVLSRDVWSIALVAWAWPELQRGDASDLPWSQDGYTLPGRTLSLGDEFVRSGGIDSKEQGGRADFVTVEDIVGETSFRSATELERRREALDHIGNLLEDNDYQSPHGGVVLVNGNNWTANDVNAKIYESLPHYEVWRRRAYCCYVHGNGNCGRPVYDEVAMATAATACAPTDESLWKARYPDAASLQRVELDRGSVVFAIQWLNEYARVADLDVAKVRPFTVEIANYLRADGTEGRGWCIVVPAIEGFTRGEVVPLTGITRHVISVDPATSTEGTAARTAISWVAFDPLTRRRYWLDCRADRWAPNDSVDTALDLYLDACEKLGSSGKRVALRDGSLPRVPRVLVEKVGAQDFMAYSLAVRGRARGIHLPQVELIPVPRGLRKVDRNRRRIGDLLGQDLLYIRLGLQLPRHEIRAFPTTTFDTLDTMSQADSVFQETRASANADALRQQRLRVRLRRQHASSTTGIPL